MIESAPRPRPSRRLPALSRRQALQAALAAGLAGAVSSLCPATPRAEGLGEADLGPLLPRVREMRSRVQANFRPLAVDVANGALARSADKPEDRHTYTVDVAQLMSAYAAAGDLEPYLALREFAAKNLVVNDKDESFTRGFVLWRHNPGQKPDASGTTEALRLVRGLWTASRVFNRKDDADLALMILDGYARHQTVDKGVWMICNYYNFGTHGFATNSFIIDYDPDLIREVADGLRDRDPTHAAELSKLADHSYGVLRKAVAPSGLLYDLLQPELATMYYNLDVSCFSPNDVIQLNNACTTAATVAKGEPAVARGTLKFLNDRADRLQIQYYGRTGEPIRDRRAAAPEYAAGARLAALLGDKAAAATFVARGIPYWEGVVSHPRPGESWVASELLLAFQAVVDLT